MVARLLEKEQLALHASVGGQAAPAAADGDAHTPVLRQLLLTASPRLCQSIRRVVRRTRAVLAAKAREQAAGLCGDGNAEATEVLGIVSWQNSHCSTNGIMRVCPLSTWDGSPPSLFLWCGCIDRT